jgi:hypothetical protein
MSAPSPISEKLRRLAGMQNWRCCYCGIRTADDLPPGHPRRATLEHILPRVLGGTNEEDNLVVACGGCNRTRGHRMGRVHVYALGLATNSKEADQVTFKLNFEIEKARDAAAMLSSARMRLCHLLGVPTERMRLGRITAAVLLSWYAGMLSTAQAFDLHNPAVKELLDRAIACERKAAEMEQQAQTLGQQAYTLRREAYELRLQAEVASRPAHKAGH